MKHGKPSQSRVQDQCQNLIFELDLMFLHPMQAYPPLEQWKRFAALLPISTSSSLSVAMTQHCFHCVPVLEIQAHNIVLAQRVSIVTLRARQIRKHVKCHFYW